MKIIYICCLFFVTSIALSSPNVHVYFEQTPNGYVVYADNPEPCPISLAIDFELVNLTSSEGNSSTFILPGNSEKNNVAELLIKYKLKSYKFDYNYTAYYGNPNLEEYDVTFKYHLPYKKGSSFKVMQGYNGSTTHKGINALDFNMPEGTEIFAARGGIVVEIVQENDKACENEGCEKYNNYILIYHNDGTFANYSHIKKDGAVVAKGDIVSIGQHIAYSGNVGRSTGPHLHLEIYLPRAESNKTLRTNFQIGDGSEFSILMEGQSYLRGYD